MDVETLVSLSFNHLRRLVARERFMIPELRIQITTNVKPNANPMYRNAAKRFSL
jgi:hypothetical protein